MKFDRVPVIKDITFDSLLKVVTSIPLPAGHSSFTGKDQGYKSAVGRYGSRHI